MRVLFDTNVLLDVLLNRQPWFTESSEVWKFNDEKRIEGFIAASTFTDIFYIARRIKDNEAALQAIHLCITAFEVCTVSQSTIVQAHSMVGKDFEDNVLIACANENHLDAIVTRNINDFKETTLSVHTPTTLLAHLSDNHDEAT